MGPRPHDARALYLQFRVQLRIMRTRLFPGRKKYPLPALEIAAIPYLRICSLLSQAFRPLRKLRKCSIIEIGHYGQPFARVCGQVAASSDPLV